MYRVTIYDYQSGKTVDETNDEDELREYVESALDDLENKNIKSFVTSRVNEGTYTKPFWEE